MALLNKPDSAMKNTVFKANPHVMFWLIGLGLSSLLIPRGANAQTPWQSAPATPAVLPNPAGVTSKPKQVVSLPPPPTSSQVSGVRTPAHVPVRSESLIPPELSPSATSLASPVNSVRSQVGLGLPNLPLPSNSTKRPVAAGFQNLPFPSMRELPFPTGNSSPATAALPGGNSAAVRSAQPALAQPSTSRNASTANAGRLVSFDTTNGGTPKAEETFNAGKLVAVVGSEHILAGDMSGIVEPIIEKNRDKLRSSSDEDRLRTQLTRQVFGQYVEIKAMYLEFFRDMVGTAPPEEIEEMKKQVMTRAGKIFFEKQVPNLLKQYDVVTLAELEEKLRKDSQSLVSRRSQFIEQVLAQELERKYVPVEFEITRDDLLKYYQEHQSDWAVPAKARWRQLTIRFDKHESNRSTVEELIKNLGNQIYLGGKPFEAVAKQSSEGYTQEAGGVYDWTTQGSLKSKPLDAAIFTLPLNRLSRVIVDDIGMHIIEVLEREEGHTRSFEESQKEIREKLSGQRRQTEVKKFRKRVLERTPIWTLWPEDIRSKAKHVRPLSEAIGDDTP